MHKVGRRVQVVSKIVDGRNVFYGEKATIINRVIETGECIYELRFDKKEIEKHNDIWFLDVNIEEFFDINVEEL